MERRRQQALGKGDGGVAVYSSVGKFLSILNWRRPIDAYPLKGSPLYHPVVSVVMGAGIHLNSVFSLLNSHPTMLN